MTIFTIIAQPLVHLVNYTFFTVLTNLMLLHRSATTGITWHEMFFSLVFLEKYHKPACYGFPVFPGTLSGVVNGSKVSILTKDMTEHISHRAAVINSSKSSMWQVKLQEISTREQILTRETHSTSGRNINSTKMVWYRMKSAKMGHFLLNVFIYLTRNVPWDTISLLCV